jgi:acyl-CoA reductase-like NAD-dependent aldehyde dehydrogenase
MGFKTEVTMDNIDEIEKDTLVFVDRAISSFEAAKKGLRTGEEKAALVLRAYHALLRWKTEYLAREKDEAFEMRVARLQELADICEGYR